MSLDGVMMSMLNHDREVVDSTSGRFTGRYQPWADGLETAASSGSNIRIKYGTTFTFQTSNQLPLCQLVTFSFF